MKCVALHEVRTWLEVAFPTVNLGHSTCSTTQPRASWLTALLNEIRSGAREAEATFKLLGKGTTGSTSSRVLCTEDTKWGHTTPCTPSLRGQLRLYLD